MIQFLFSKVFFGLFKRPSLKWKLSKSFPSIFFSPYLRVDEYLLFDKICRSKDVILEYGSGGSTIYFVKNRKRIYSVESNREFYKYMASIKMVRKALGDSLYLKFIDLGKTNTVGSPLSREYENDWHKYYSEIWNKIIVKENKIDIIYIDGRFRVACCVYSIMKILENKWENPIIIIHDFYDRKEYQTVLKFLDKIGSASRLGVFAIKKDVDIYEVKDVLFQYSKVRF